MKIIHWEYNQANDKKYIERRHIMKAGLTHNSETNAVTGFYFRWTYLILKSSQVYIHCIAEDKYSTKDVFNISLQELKILISLSEKKFKKALADQLNFEFEMPVYPLDDYELTNLAIEHNRLQQ